MSDIDLCRGEDEDALIRQIRQHEAERGGFLPAGNRAHGERAPQNGREESRRRFQVHRPTAVEPAALTAAIAAMTDHPSHDKP